MTAPARIVTVNPGSHSLQLGLFVGHRTERLNELDDDPSSETAGTALADFIADAARDGPIDVISYRLVHGGDLITEPTALDDRLRDDLDQFTSLAPSHNPATLACIDIARRDQRSTAHLVCPDTAFHASMPRRATTLAVPQTWRERYRVRRYGFHGVSYGWAMQRAAQLLGASPASLNMIISHLGGGCSVCAIHNGRSVWTTMGMTPSDGLVMTRRSGAVDPGLLLWLQTSHGLTADQIAEALQHDSGLLALSAGRSADTRDLVAAAANGDRDAALAMEIFSDSVRRSVAAAATMLPAVDAIVFTGEIGYDQPEVREAVCGGLGILGVPTMIDRPDPGDRIISPADAHPAVLTIETGEADELARLARHFLETSR